MFRGWLSTLNKAAITAVMIMWYFLLILPIAAIFGFLDGQILLSLATLLISIAIGVWLIKSLNHYKSKCNASVSAIERELANQGFTVSRKIGEYHFTYPDVSSWYLFVDDVNKKWLMTAPLHDKPDMTIRKFEDLIDFGFFDEESNKPLDGAVRTMDTAGTVGLKIAGAATGAYVGRLAGGSVIGGRTGMAAGAVVGGIGGAAVGAKMGGFLTRSRAEGASGEYGIEVLTTDCSATTPVLRFDFLKSGYQPIARATRTSGIYKKNVAIMEEMGQVLSYILMSSENTANQSGAFCAGCGNNLAEVSGAFCPKCGTKS